MTETEWGPHKGEWPLWGKEKPRHRRSFLLAENGAVWLELRRGGRLVDWKAIETEYITTDTSYRKLAQKHGVNVTSIAKKASAEGWVDRRKQYTTKTQAKTLEKISQKEADRAAKIGTVADKLLQQIEAMVDRDEPLDEKAIRSLTAAVKDLKEIQGVRSALDRQEQEARIANLQKQAEKSDKGGGKITVVLEGVLKDYAQ